VSTASTIEQLDEHIDADVRLPQDVPEGSHWDISIPVYRNSHKAAFIAKPEVIVAAPDSHNPESCAFSCPNGFPPAHSRKPSQDASTSISVNSVG
jgi:hypothetical protein